MAARTVGCHWPEAPQESVEGAYFRQWAAALEELLGAHGVSHGVISKASEHWRRSYLATRHGEPVVFARHHAAPFDGAGHDHHHRHPLRDPQPVAEAVV
ncbi:hypothetical protein RPE78_16125 (plasmid) [Thioclava litoralis]|uniref:Nitrile hydratase accessory protein n=1 Tax=Thioclava litoralis TaxID=3076557 RepID=A0ABZ1E5M4_9RHOB|nr:hypothetical protein RPE78_16125 [Thioclava sp. FTW29]